MFRNYTQNPNSILFDKTWSPPKVKILIPVIKTQTGNTGLLENEGDFQSG